MCSRGIFSWLSVSNACLALATARHRLGANGYADEFVARSTDELSLKKGDRIELIERDDDFGDGWYLGKHLTDGSTGLFPEGARH